jgi:rhodanese-related sulfurtransferase
MSIQSVDANTLKTWLDKSQAVLVDVREPAEHQAEYISAAALVPLSTVCLKALPSSTGKKLVLHCRSGKRSASACEKLLAENPNLDIYNLEGGIMAWASAGNPVKKSGSFFLPLDRQVQMTIGLCVLTGSILGYFVSPKFFLLTGFFGAGLTFAGLTGYCGLAMIMAKMPWNQSGASSSGCRL